MYCAFGFDISEAALLNRLLTLQIAVIFFDASLYRFRDEMSLLSMQLTVLVTNPPPNSVEELTT